MASASANWILIENLCTGCGRTISEITQWRDMEDTDREDVIKALPSRLAALRRRNPDRA